MAIAMHDGCGHKRSDGEPYWRHPERIVQTLHAAGLAEDVLSAAWLHDVPEDCPEDRAGCEALLIQIDREFGSTVGNLVREVTNFATSSESMEEKQARLREHAKHMTDHAKWIKLADRLDNISGMHGWSNQKKVRYAQATVALLDALRPWPMGSDALAAGISQRANAILAAARAD